MARDANARNKSLLDRRSYLRSTGGAIASVIGARAVTSTAKASEYDTITVSAGESKVFRIGSGETFENKLIDCTASGATALLRPSGSGWTIRNVGIKGAMPTGLNGKVLVPSVPDASGHGLIENVYLGDGIANYADRKTMDGMVWVDNSHRGTITFRDVHIADASTGVYASGPGYQHGSAGGDVHIESCFVKNTNIAGFRPSGDGSYVKDSVVAQTGAVNMAPSGARNARGIWLKDYGDMLVENCDIDVSGPHGTHAVVASHGASGLVKDCRVAGGPLTDVQTQNISNNPSREPPVSCPTTPEEAASGTSDVNDGSSGSGTTTDPDEDDGDEDGTGTLLELVAGPNTSNAEYQFTVEGSVRKRTSSSGDKTVAEDNDTVTDNGDGTVTVSGVSGNGYGDAFYVEGAITSMDLDESQWTIRYGGEEVSVQDIALPNKLIIDGSNRPHIASTYTFEVSGTARKSETLGSINSYDEISDGAISGRVVGGTDGYRFSGEIAGFSLDGPANVRVEDGP